MNVSKDGEDTDVNIGPRPYRTREHLSLLGAVQEVPVNVSS